jgi:hypothetical protein
MKAAVCYDALDAIEEVERLMRLIDGFQTCTVESIKREPEQPPGWEALINDPADEFEYSRFWINDDGSVAWD